MDRRESQEVLLSRAEHVYRIIKADVISLKLRPGSIIQEDALAEQLGVSRTPLREALHRLSQEGWVKCLPKKGTIVTSVSLDDVREVMQGRLCVEPTAARLAADRIPQEEIDRLRDLLAAPSERGAAANDRHLELHRSIARHCGNRRLASIVVSLADETVRIVNVTEPGTYLVNRQSHLKILDALQARDGALSEQVMREHILGSGLLASRLVAMT